MSNETLEQLAQLLSGDLDVGYLDGTPEGPEYIVPETIGIRKYDDLERDLEDMTVEEAYAAGRLMEKYTNE